MIVKPSYNSVSFRSRWWRPANTTMSLLKSGRRSTAFSSHRHLQRMWRRSGFIDLSKWRMTTAQRLPLRRRRRRKRTEETPTMSRHRRTIFSDVNQRRPPFNDILRRTSSAAPTSSEYPRRRTRTSFRFDHRQRCRKNFIGSRQFRGDQIARRPCTMTYVAQCRDLVLLLRRRNGMRNESVADMTKMTPFCCVATRVLAAAAAAAAAEAGSFMANCHRVVTERRSASTNCASWMRCSPSHTTRTAPFARSSPTRWTSPRQGYRWAIINLTEAMGTGEKLRTSPRHGYRWAVINNAEAGVQVSSYQQCWGKGVRYKGTEKLRTSRRQE